MSTSLTQCRVESLAERDWDALVVGAGPAGATASAKLAARGYRVALLDRHRFPRDKVCGDILIPDALRALERLGLSERIHRLGHPLKQAAVFSPSRHEIAIPGHYVTLRRYQLDALLVEHAVGAGAVLCQGQAATLGNAGEYVVCDCAGGTRLRSRVGVIATGANRDWLTRQQAEPSAPASALAVRQYVSSPLSLDRLVFAYDRSTLPGYAWIAPLGDGVFNIGCGISFRGAPPRRTVNLRTMLRDFANEFPLARALMAHAKTLSPLRGAMLRCGLDSQFLTGLRQVLAIGETIGTTYPFSGEGIGKAMETGELAADAIHEAFVAGETRRLCQFPARLEHQLRSRYAGYEAAERWLSRPWLNDLVLRRVRQSPYLQSAFAGIVEESVDPQRIFSLAGLFQSLWR